MLPPSSPPNLPDSAGPEPSEPPVTLWDGVGAVGLVFLIWGVWQIFAPAAWITLGVALLVIAWRS